MDGNIGYHAAGKLPIRRNYYGDIPVSGATGDNEWDGTIPFDDLPQAYNPPSGFAVTANQNPFPVDYPYHVSGAFAPAYRSRQILEDGDGPSRASRGVPHAVDGLGVFVERAVRVVEPRDVHAGRDHPDQHLGIAGGRADRRDYLGAAHTPKLSVRRPARVSASFRRIAV